MVAKGRLGPPVCVGVAVPGIPAEQLVAAHGNFDTARCLKTGRPVPVEELAEAVRDGTWEQLRRKYRGLVKPAEAQWPASDWPVACQWPASDLSVAGQHPST